MASASSSLHTPDEDAPEAYLSALYVYPIKSAGGIPLEASEVDDRGLRHDRRWMLVDETGRFMSQRRFPRMALIGVRIEPDGLVVGAPGMPSLEVPFRLATERQLLALVWEDLVEVLAVGEEADRWFGEFLGVRCRLVYLPDESVRPVDQTHGKLRDQVGLADGFPFLLVSEASLADLNARLELPVSMNRFRPNLVVGGCEPFAEDGWGLVRIGRITLRAVKPCARATPSGSCKPDNTRPCIRFSGARKQHFVNWLRHYVAILSDSV